ncbi:hypothetical protein [Salinadaptatus halalkaliphilus]|nr:hypothetical protein [Salinadaptatus halalkaliphilus]
MTDIRPDHHESVDHETVRRVGKFLLACLGLVVLSSLVSLLPGIDRLVPGTPISFVAVVSAVVTLAIVGLLVYLAPALAKLVRSVLEGPEQVVDDIAAIVQLVVVFVAVLVAHQGLAPAIGPLLGGLGWVYDLVFLAIALPPLGILAARMYVSLDPMAELLANRVAGTSSEPRDDDQST